ncbi:unnamed protein product, partial [marine sediment metagenome]
IFRRNSGGPVCALRDKNGQWTSEIIDSSKKCAFVAATLSAGGQPLVAYAADPDGKGPDELRMAEREAAGKWSVKAIATAPEGRVVGRTDIAVASNKIGVAWHAAHPKKHPDKHEGDVKLTVVGSGTITTHDIGANCGRPSLVLTPDGKRVFLGAYTGGKQGQDFVIFSVGLEGNPALALKAPAEKKAEQRIQATRNELHSGDYVTHREALKVVAGHRLKPFGREAYEFFKANPKPEDRVIAIKAMGEIGADG